MKPLPSSEWSRRCKQLQYTALRCQYLSIWRLSRGRYAPEYIRCTQLHCCRTKYDTLFDMLYDERFEMIYDKSRRLVIWPNNWSAISGTAHFEMTKWLSLRKGMTYLSKVTMSIFSRWFMIVFSKASPFLLAKKIETATETSLESPDGKAFSCHRKSKQKKWHGEFTSVPMG